MENLSWPSRGARELKQPGERSGSFRRKVSEVGRGVGPQGSLLYLTLFCSSHGFYLRLLFITRLPEETKRPRAGGLGAKCDFTAGGFEQSVSGIIGHSLGRMVGWAFRVRVHFAPMVIPRLFYVHPYACWLILSNGLCGAGCGRLPLRVFVKLAQPRGMQPRVAWYPNVFPPEAGAYLPILFMPLD